MTFEELKLEYPSGTKLYNVKLHYIKYGLSAIEEFSVDKIITDNKRDYILCDNLSWEPGMGTLSKIYYVSEDIIGKHVFKTKKEAIKKYIELRKNLIEEHNKIIENINKEIKELELNDN